MHHDESILSTLSTYISMHNHAFIEHYWISFWRSYHPPKKEEEKIYVLLNIFDRCCELTIVDSMVESADSALESANRRADPMQIGVGTGL